MSTPEPPWVDVVGVVQVVAALKFIIEVGIAKALLHFLDLVKSSEWATLNPVEHKSKFLKGATVGNGIKRKGLQIVIMSDAGLIAKQYCGNVW